MPVKVVHLPNIGNVTFSQNSRIKNVKLSVRASQEVRVSYPLWVSSMEAMDFIRRHTTWISERQLKFQKEVQPAEFPLKTRYHTLSIREGGDKFRVEQKKFDVTLYHPAGLSPDDSAIVAFKNRVLNTIHRWEAKHYLPGRIAELAKRHGFVFGKVTIRNNRSNWGSCSSRNNISLNLKLMKLPDHLIDFVLLHELAHTRIKNHGPMFWELLDNLSEGKAKSYTQELKRMNNLVF